MQLRSCSRAVDARVSSPQVRMASGSSAGVDPAGSLAGSYSPDLPASSRGRPSVKQRVHSVQWPGPSRVLLPPQRRPQPLGVDPKPPAAMLLHDTLGGGRRNPRRERLSAVRWGHGDGWHYSGWAWPSALARYGRVKTGLSTLLLTLARTHPYMIASEIAQSHAHKLARKLTRTLIQVHTHARTHGRSLARSLARPLELRLVPLARAHSHAHSLFRSRVRSSP